MAEIPGTLPPMGAIAVIFISMRTDADDVGYGEAADRMERLAAKRPGYLGIDSVRGGEGVGITVSYWTDEASARAWKANAEHEAIRDLGRERWYACYRLIIAKVERAYGWRR